MICETVSLKNWTVPNFAQFDIPARPKQDGIRELPTVPVAELSASALSWLAEAWLTELYAKAGKPHDWNFVRDESPTP